MAEDQQEVSLSATFPGPPPFYKHFTARNLERLREAQEAAESAEAPQSSTEESNGSKAPAEQQQSGKRRRRRSIPNLAPELRYLVPPEPPEDGKYRAFGDQYDLHEPLPTLTAQGVEQLYPTDPSTTATTSASPTDISNDRASILKRLTRSILLNYLELVGLLAHSPSSYAAKIDDLSTIFINAHHLINEYRPHQARETLILTMEEQLRRKRAGVEGVKGMRGKVEETLARVGEMGRGTEAEAEAGVYEGRDTEVDWDEDIEDGTVAGKRDAATRLEIARQRDVWTALEVEVGPKKKMSVDMG